MASVALFPGCGLLLTCQAIKILKQLSCSGRNLSERSSVRSGCSSVLPATCWSFFPLLPAPETGISGAFGGSVPSAYSIQPPAVYSDPLAVDRKAAVVARKAQGPPPAPQDTRTGQFLPHCPTDRATPHKTSSKSQ